MSVYELINPSDRITFETEHEAALIAGVLMICRGWMIGLERVDDSEIVLPALALLSEPDSRSWLKEVFGDDFSKYLDEHYPEIAEACGSILYGDATDRELFHETCAGKTAEEIRDFRKRWNDKKRTSLTDYSRAFLAYADKLEKINPYRKEDIA